MGLFGRRKASGEDLDEPSADVDVDDESLDFSAQGGGGDEEAVPEALTDGPYDSGDIPAALWAGHLDLGSLRLPRLAGMALQLEVDQTQQVITAAVASFGTSSAQLQAFAAPRSDGLWAEIRGEIAASLRAQGGTAADVEGPFGIELHGGLPAGSGRQPAPVRFIGVDGGRWFLRIALSGTGAGSAAIEQMLRQVVVVRDGEARPPRELLPLHAPHVAEASAAVGTAAGAESAESGADTSASTPGARRTSDDLRPFERGPEITEVR